MANRGRPCHCDKVTTCRLCWLAAHDERYRRLWNVELEPEHEEGAMKWAYGVLTVPDRLFTHLVPTLDSMAAAGFTKPHLFIDRCDDPSVYGWLKLPMTWHGKNIKTVGNWVLGMYELFYHYPDADRYVMFQDDVSLCKNLKPYLERLEYPTNGYCNLYTFPVNKRWYKGGHGWHPTNPNRAPGARGLGALALMFDRKALALLLCSPHMVIRVTGHRKDISLDGGIVDAMTECEIQEYVHNPSLVQHTGETSTMDKLLGKSANVKVVKNYKWGKDTFADDFMGEDYDALNFLGGNRDANIQQGAGRQDAGLEKAATGGCC